MTITLDAVDIYHGNAISDPAKIPADLIALSHKITEGAHSTDPLCASRLPILQRYTHRGLAHWVRSDSTIADQVAHFGDSVVALGPTVYANGQLLAGWYLLIDWETTKNVPDMTVANIEAFEDGLVKRFGDRVIMYGADWVPGFVQWRKDRPTFPLWYAVYNTASAKPAQYRATCWQYTDAAVVPGFTLPVDASTILDRALFDRVCAIAPVVPPVVDVPTTPPHPEAPIDPTEEDMPMLTNSQPRDIGDGRGPYGPGVAFYTLDASNNAHRITPDKAAAIKARGGVAAAVAMTNDELNQLGAA